jgi:hypothetical protein
MAIDWRKIGQISPTVSPSPSLLSDVPPPTPGATPEVTPTPHAERPGILNINLSPGGFAPAMEENARSTGDILDTLNNTIFGQKGIIGQFTKDLHFDNPVTDTIGNLGGAVGGLAGGVVRAPFVAASRLPLGWLPNGVDEHFRNLRSDAVARGVWTAQDEQAWQTVDKGAAGDVLDGANQKYNYLQEFSRSQNEPDLFPMLSHGAAGSLGGVLAQVFGGAFAVPQAIAARTIGGVPKILSGMDRVEETLAIAQYNPGDLNDVEKVVVQKMGDGSWTKDQALDFMTGRYDVLSHNEALNVAGSFATDPTVIASLGAAGLARIGATGARITSALNAASEAERAAITLTDGQRFAVSLNAAAQGGIGRVSKGLRSIIDPLSAIGGNHSVTKGAVNLLTQEGSAAVWKSFGQGAINDVWRMASEEGWKIDGAAKTYVGNILRPFAATRQRATLLKADRIENVIGTVPDEAVLGKTLAASKSGFDEVADFADSVRKSSFSEPDLDSLANRLAESGDFGSRTPGAWRDFLTSASDGTRGLLHALSYGSADRAFQIARREAIAAGKVSLGRVGLDELVLLSERNVDNVIAKELGAKITSAKSTTSAIEAIQKAIDDFPTFRLIGDVPKTRAQVDKWVEYLVKRIDENAFHSRVLPGELKSLPDEIRQFVADHPSWNLGFAPDNSVKWGLGFDVDGNIVTTHLPHVGHVADAGATFRPTADVARDFLGRMAGPRVGDIAGKLLDPIEIYARTGSAQVSGLRLVQNMEQRFRRFTSEGYGMTEAESKKVFGAIKEATIEQKVTMQGMTREPLWNAAKDLIPARLKNKIGPRELMILTMRASEGDLRIVGTAPKLTNRIRTMLVESGLTPNNWTGQVSVDLYNKARYVLNPVFIGQRISDIGFFSVMHGTWAARKLRPGTPEFRAQAVLDKMVDTSFLRNFALENVEYRQWGDFAEIFTSKLKPAASKIEAITQGETRLIQAGQIKWVYRNMGNLVKDSLADLQKLYPNATLPASFDQLAARYSAEAGRILQDDEVGLHYLEEQFHAGQLATPEGIPRLIEEGAHSMPVDQGELIPLNLNQIGKDLGFGDLKGMRAAMVPSEKGAATLDNERLIELLTEQHFHPDQIDRVLDGVKFEWDTTMRDVQTTLSMSNDEMTRLQLIIRRAAKDRGMVPAEYLSQVMAHNVKKVGFKRGLEGLPEELRPTVELMRTAMIGPERERVAALVKAVYTHLDPSAQRTLLEEFQVDIGVRIQGAMNAGRTEEAQFLNRVAEELRGGWGPAADSAFTDQVIARMGGEIAANPEVERTVQYVAKWAKEAFLPTLARDQESVGRGLAQMVDSIPTSDAFAYNKTEAMTLQLMRDNMNRVVMDSHRVADMSKSRSVFMRSLNHPLFGIYPASYMWGKVVPEFVRFIGQTPFGLRTGALAYGLQDIQTALAAQYELDPTFQKKIEEIGNSESAFLLSYLLPSYPWEDISAGVAPAIRSFADRGLSSELITKQLDMMSPNRWINSAAGAVGEASDLVSSLVSPQASTPPAPAPGAAPATGAAGQLEGPLSESQQDLNEVLSSILR